MAENEDVVNEEEEEVESTILDTSLVGVEGHDGEGGLDDVSDLEIRDILPIPSLVPVISKSQKDPQREMLIHSKYSMLKSFHAYECESYDVLLKLYNSFVARLDGMESTQKDFQELVTLRNLSKKLSDNAFLASKKAFDECSLFYQQFGPGIRSSTEEY